MKSTVITADSRNIHNYYIDIFRFLLILWIVLFHYTVQYNALGLDKPFVFPYSFENGGTVGVSLFFMVSGFFMTKTLMSDKYGFREYGRYLARRYLRLWIPYAFACIILYLWLLFLPVEGRTVDLSTLLANVACVIHPGFDRVDNAHWFIADLLVVQLLLGLLIFVRNNRYKQIIINCLFVIVMVAQVIHPPLLSGFSKELFEVLLGTHIWMMVKDRDIRSLILTLIGLAVVVYLSIYMFIGAVVFFTIVLLGEKCPPPARPRTPDFKGILT